MLPWRVYNPHGLLHVLLRSCSTGEHVRVDMLGSLQVACVKQGLERGCHACRDPPGAARRPWEASPSTPRPSSSLATPASMTWRPSPGWGSAAATPPAKPATSSLRCVFRAPPLKILAERALDSRHCAGNDGVEIMMCHSFAWPKPR